VVAVLDWEFAVSGSSLADLGNFLRYERASQSLAERIFQPAICTPAVPCRPTGGAWRD